MALLGLPKMVLSGLVCKRFSRQWTRTQNPFLKNSDFITISQETLQVFPFRKNPENGLKGQSGENLHRPILKRVFPGQ